MVGKEDGGTSPNTAACRFIADFAPTFQKWPSKVAANEKVRICQHWDLELHSRV